MMSSESLTKGSFVSSECATSAVFPVAYEVLCKRRDFIAASRGKRCHQPGFVVQVRRRRAEEHSNAPIRIGFTCTKKVGNAVARNRAKRRMREIARAVIPEFGQAKHDYVLVGRRDDTATIPFNDLIEQLQAALKILHGGKKP